MVTGKIIILLFLSYLVGLMFNLVPELPPKNYFLFAGVEISLKTHSYFMCDHLSRMFIFWALMTAVPITAIFFWIEFLDLIDYLVCYNSTWFEIMGYGVEFNDFKLIIISIFVLWKLGRH